MASLDTVNALAFFSALDPIVLNNDTEGTGIAIDTAGYNSLALIASAGTNGDTHDGSNFFNLKVQKSVDSAFTSPAAVGSTELYDDGGVLGQATYGFDNSASDDNRIFRVGIKLDPDYRYYRIMFDVTGTLTNGVPVSALAILGGGERPQAIDNLLS